MILSISSIISDAPESALLILNSTSLALSAFPSEKTTPSRRVNTHVSGSVASHDVANCGSIDMSRPRVTKLS